MNCSSRLGVSTLTKPGVECAGVPLYNCTTVHCTGQVYSTAYVICRLRNKNSACSLLQNTRLTRALGNEPDNTARPLLDSFLSKRFSIKYFHIRNQNSLDFRPNRDPNIRFTGVQCTDHPDCHYYRGWFNLNFVMHSDFPSVKARNGTGSAQPSHAGAGKPVATVNVLLVLWWMEYTGPGEKI